MGDHGKPEASIVHNEVGSMGERANSTQTGDVHGDLIVFNGAEIGVQNISLGDTHHHHR